MLLDQMLSTYSCVVPNVCVVMLGTVVMAWYTGLLILYIGIGHSRAVYASLETPMLCIYAPMLLMLMVTHTGTTTAISEDVLEVGMLYSPSLSGCYVG